MRKSHGLRRGTRDLFSKPAGSREGPRPEIYLSRIGVGENVLISVDPSVQKGMPHRRFHGKIGKVLEKRGRGYVVEVRMGNKPKKITVLPDHIKPWRGEFG